MFKVVFFYQQINRPYHIFVYVSKVIRKMCILEHRSNKNNNKKKKSIHNHTGAQSTVRIGVGVEGLLLGEK